MKKCGFVSIIVESNAGKSALINQLVGQKVSIVSRKIQTTVSRILGIAIYNDCQIIFIDTPGFLTKKQSLEKVAWDAFRESEDILFVVDVTKKNFERSIGLLKKINAEKKVSLILNKIDLIHKPKILEIINQFKDIRNFKNIFAVSALTGDGVNDIKKYLEKVLPEGDWIFPEDEITDASLEKYAAEITREHIYHRIHQEVPYACRVETCHCENMLNGELKIFQNIIVNNLSHKVIMVGHRGEKIGAIRQAANDELSKLLERKVQLHLKVILSDDIKKK